MTLERLVVAAGLGQLALVAASPAIPVVLRWKEETAKLRPVLRHLFWTYGGYILGTNLAMGLVSAFAPQWLLDGSGLAAAVSGYMALYWGARLVLQVGFDRGDVPAGAGYRAAEAALVLLFGFLTTTYAALLTSNLHLAR